MDPFLFLFIISEIMADPIGSDNTFEFVEIELFENTSYLSDEYDTFLSEEITIDDLFQNSQFIISDLASNDTLIYEKTFGVSLQENTQTLQTLFTHKNILLVVEEGFDYSSINESKLLEQNISCHIYSAGSTIGNNLGNDADALFFYAKQNTSQNSIQNQAQNLTQDHTQNQTPKANYVLVANISYVLSGCAKGEGCSLQHTSEPSLFESSPTPCFPSENMFNKSDANTHNATHNVTNNEINNETTNNTQANTTQANNETNTAHTNQTLTNTNNSQEFSSQIQTTPSCPLTLEIVANTLFDEGESIAFTPNITFSSNSSLRLLQNNFELTYWWEDLYGHIVKDPITTLNDKQKHYTPKLPTNEKDWVLTLHMRLVTFCNESTANHLVVIAKDEDAYIEDEKNALLLATQTTNGKSTNSNQEYKNSLSENTSTSSLANPLLTLDVPLRTEETFTAQITLFNPQDEAQDYLLSTYAYIASSNKTPRTQEVVSLGAGQTQIITKEFTLPPGNYSFKSQLFIPNRKTPIEEKRMLEVFSFSNTSQEASQKTLVDDSKNILFLDKNSSINNSLNSQSLDFQNLGSESVEEKEQKNDLEKISGNTILDSTLASVFDNKKNIFVVVFFTCALLLLAKLIGHHNASFENETPESPLQDLNFQNQENASLQNTTLHMFLDTEKNQKDDARLKF